MNRQVFHKNAVFKNLAKFTGKLLCWRLLSNENVGLQSCNFKLKTDSNTGVFLSILQNF